MDAVAFVYNEPVVAAPLPVNSRIFAALTTGIVLFATGLGMGLVSIGIPLSIVLIIYGIALTTFALSAQQTPPTS